MEVNGLRVNYRVEGAGGRWVGFVVPGARHVSAPGAAHIANIQNPAAFNRVLRDFFG